MNQTEKGEDIFVFDVYKQVPLRWVILAPEI